MRFLVISDTGEEEADNEYVAVDWQELIAILEAEGILSQVTQIKIFRHYDPPTLPARDMDDIPF